MGVWDGEDMEAGGMVHGNSSSLIVEVISVSGAEGNWKTLLEEGE